VIGLRENGRHDSVRLNLGLGRRDVGVANRGRDVRMAHCLLHVRKVNASADHVGRVRVLQDVRIGATVFDPREFGALAEKVVNLLA